jgi:hypothetical protein
MASAAAQKKLAENEVIFRTFNESVQQRLDEIKAMAKEEGQSHITLDENEPLYFFCECADENCKKRVKISPKDYNRIHRSRDVFTVICGHEVTEVERVIAKTPDYCVVKKFRQPPKAADKLHTTDVNNS